MRRTHGGTADRGVLDFSVSLNPLGPPDSLGLLLTTEHLTAYPEPHSQTLQEAIAKYHGVASDSVLVTNGACEAIELVMACLRPRRVVVLVPAFTEYEDAARAWGHNVVTIAAREEDGFAWEFSRFDVHPDDLVVLSNPANPTGVVSNLPEIGGTRLVDETFLDFVDDSVGNALIGVPRTTEKPSTAPFTVAGAEAGRDRPFLCQDALPASDAPVGAQPGHRRGGTSRAEPPVTRGSAPATANLRVQHRTASLSAINRPRTLVVRSFTKIFACPGLRLGYIVGDVSPLRRRQATWSVSRLAQVAGEAMLRETAYLEFTRRFVRECREELVAGLRSLPGVKVFAPAANFVFFSVPHANDLARRLREQGMVVRSCDDFTGLAPDRYLRVAVRKRSENQRLLEALHAAR